MIKELLSSARARLVLAALIILLIFNIALSIYRTYSPTQPSLTSISPSGGATGIALDQKVTFFFKDPVVASDFTVSSTPSLSWELAQINSNTIMIAHPLDFQPSTSYIINLSWKSQPYPPITITTMKSQTDSLLIQNMKDELERDYPLAQILPYNTADYRVVYSSPMTLEITLKNTDLSSTDAVSQIKSWVTKNGGDSMAHKYIIAP